jgi:uncharacterized membrane protein YdfJ with MMPL/SSD domain
MQHLRGRVAARTAGPERVPIKVWITIAAWCVLVGLGAYYAPKLGGVVLKGSPVTPGSESAVAAATIEREFRGGGARLLMVFTHPTWDARNAPFANAVRDAAGRARGIEGVTRVTSFLDVQAPETSGASAAATSMISRDGRAAFVVVDAAVGPTEAQNRIVPALRKVVAEVTAGAAGAGPGSPPAPTGLTGYVTGEAAIGADIMSEVMSSLVRSERLVIPIVLLVLVLVFGSVVAAMVPLILGVASVTVTAGIFYFWASRNPVADLAPVVISMIGLGVGVDYALFLVTRFREELSAGEGRAAAVRRTMATSGRAVVFSGATVAVSVASLYLVNSPIIQSLALAMILVVAVSVLAAVTLLPSVLYLLGPSIAALSLPWRRTPRAPATGIGAAAGAGPAPATQGGFWRRWTAIVMRWPGVFAALTIVLLLVIASPVLKMKTGWASLSLLPRSAEARAGFEILRDRFDAGAAAPVEVLVRVERGTVADAANLPRLYALAQALRSDPEVATVTSHVSLDPAWDLARYREIYLDGPAQMAALPSRLREGGEGLVNAARGLGQVRDGLVSVAAGLETLEARLAGAPPGVADALRPELARIGGSLLGLTGGLSRIIPSVDSAGAGLRQTASQTEGLDLGPALTRGDFGLRLLMAAGGPVTRDLIPELVNIDRGADLARFTVYPRGGPDDPKTLSLVRRLRSEILPAGTAGLGSAVVGGGPAQLVDFKDAMDRALPRVVAIVLLITYVVLLVLLRSVWLPLLAVAVNGLSVLAAYGALVMVFEKGYGARLLGFTPLGYVESVIVVVLFAGLFGLSMDYQVFMLTRVKENYDRLGRSDESVAAGLEQSGAVITGAALIMVVVFGAFVLTGMITIKEIGFGLAFAVLLDATVIRLALVPAAMRLMGAANWWAPVWLRRAEGGEGK